MDVQVVDANLIVNRPAGKSGGAVGNRVAECTVGDETGVIVLIVKNEQGTFPFLIVSRIRMLSFSHLPRILECCSAGTAVWSLPARFRLSGGQNDGLCSTHFLH